MVIKWKILPENVLSNGKRYHHFVYGNILLLATSYLVIGVGVEASNTFLAIAYGIALGLILDEFPHWMGSVKELTRNVLVVPGSVIAVAIAEFIIVATIILKVFGTI